MGVEQDGMVELASGTATMLLARIEALTARLDEQAATIGAQQAEIATLKSAPDGPALAQHVPPSEKPKLARRGLLTKLLGATAAAALLSVAREAPSAQPLRALQHGWRTRQPV
jgi:hypothetical protein